MKTLLVLLVLALAIFGAARADAYCQNVRVCYGPVCRFEQRCYGYRAPVCMYTNRCFSQRVCNAWGCRYQNVCQPVQVCN
ncbi:MAG TPA: hypothetical protein VMZ28_04925 [Kofleriaceae bacterium]|nr:hypothetical protein [Kofleriaceae bacterium]